MFLGIGMLATNIARYSAVRRLGRDGSNVERTGAFYNLIAPSRFGKGIAISLVTELGSYIEKLRTDNFNEYVRVKQEQMADPSAREVQNLRYQVSLERPHLLFLTGGNALQTQSVAAKNAGCGMIVVSEIKSGKAAYTDHSGAYTPLLDFYDPQIQGTTFRKAEVIPTVPQCRIQLLAAGIKEDWIPFVEKSGPTAGTLARVIPILSFDRDTVRLPQEKLPPSPFSLDGFKKAFAVMEFEFANSLATDNEPPITLQFSRSNLQEQFRRTNALLIRDFRQDGDVDYGRILSTLHNCSPPNASSLTAEASGEGLLTIFIRQTIAEYKAMSLSPGDDNFLRGFEANILRVASDFF